MAFREGWFRKKTCVSGNRGPSLSDLLENELIPAPNVLRHARIHARGNSFDMSRVDHTLSEP